MHVTGAPLFNSARLASASISAVLARVDGVMAGAKALDGKPMGVLKAAVAQGAAVPSARGGQLAALAEQQPRHLSRAIETEMMIIAHQQATLPVEHIQSLIGQQ